MTETLERFARRFSGYSASLAAEILRVDPVEFGVSDLVYIHDSALCYFTDHGKNHCAVTIGNSGAIGSRNLVIAELYFSHAVSECFHDRTPSTLSRLLVDFSDWSRRDLASAAEMQARIDPATPRDRSDSAWLQWYREKWDLVTLDYA